MLPAPGGGTHGTHVAACTDAPWDPLNATTYVCPPPSDGSKDFRGYDWFNGEGTHCVTGG